MAETTGISATKATLPATSTAQATSNATISSDFNTFLKMLTTQLQNQDPLDPMDSAEFSMQLATFSGVEQQVKTNDLLTSLSGQFGILGMAELAGWVGKDARAAVPGYYEGDPIAIYPTILPSADEATLVVRNSFGNVVDRRNIPLPADQISWSGLGENGTPLPTGSYSFSIESKAGTTALATTVPDVYNTILEARLQDGATMLVLEGDKVVAGSAIKALR